MNIYSTLLLLVIGTLPLIGEEEFNSFPSFQGFNGVVNTPNSKTLKEGEFEFLYTNQVDNFSSSSSSSMDFRDNRDQESFFLNMGLLPNLDISLRYSHGIDNIKKSDYLSDRIINFKYQLPFIPNDIASVAFGMQDIGGRAQHLSSQYIIASKDFNRFRTSLGYALSKDDGILQGGALDGAFGSIEYQPFSWLQIAGEYDSKEWNGVIKSNYTTTINNKNVNFGLMAKSSLEYSDPYFGLYSRVLFDNKSLPKSKKDRVKSDLPSSIDELKDFGFSNISSTVDNDRLFFEYENTLYVYNDIDALGVVLGVLSKNSKLSTLEVTIKRADIAQYTLRVDTKAYREFLKTGHYKDGLLQFLDSTTRGVSIQKSDRFKPILTLQPAFTLIDGSEYGHMDYTFAMQAELSMRLAKGLIASTRYNMPLAITDNFKEYGVFDYRNRNKFNSSFDEILLSQYFQIDSPFRWINLLQAGVFDKDLQGISFESAIGNSDGKHLLLIKLSSLRDELYNQMDFYYDKSRREKLLSYHYYLDSLGSTLKLTGGEFLYGDRGISVGFERHFSDLSFKFDIAQTKHDLKGTNKVGKFTLSIPFVTTKRYKTDYFDIKGDYLVYNRRKTLVSKDDINNISQPHHLKEVNNNFTLEKYYLNSDRFYPIYIKNNYNRLRNIFLTN